MTHGAVMRSLKPNLLFIFLATYTAFPTVRIVDGKSHATNDNEYIVMFHGKSTRDQPTILEGMRQKSGVYLGNRYVAVVEADAETLTRLNSDPDVHVVEQNQMARYDKPIEFVDHGDIEEPVRMNTYTGSEDKVCHETFPGRYGWGLIRTSHRSMPDFDRDPYVYGEHDSGAGVDIYILDTGLFYQHDEFEGRAFHGFTAPFVPDGDEDLEGHGTHVGGTAGGKRFGVSKKSTLIGVKVLNAEGSGYWSDVVAGIAFAMDRHVNKTRESGRPARSVLNLSLGGPAGLYTIILETAFQMATEAGLHVVTSSGNDFDDSCFYSPGRSNVALTVGASNINDSMAVFSNFGPCTNILAPGRTIIGPYIGGTKRYVTFSGTSMASPHVAGIVARYISQFSDEEIVHVTPAIVRAKLMDTASRSMIKWDSSVAGQIATPNRLLYKGCYDPDERDEITSTTTKTSTVPETTTKRIVTTTVTEARTTVAEHETSSQLVTTVEDKQSSTYTTNSDTTSTSNPMPTADFLKKDPGVENPEQELNRVAPLVVATLSVSAVMVGVNLFSLCLIYRVSKKSE